MEKRKRGTHNNRQYLCGQQSEMPVNCLVCGKPTSVTNMGMDACRACAVFYRRNRTKRLACVMNYPVCVNEPQHTFACRKCRVERFEAILSAGTDQCKTVSSAHSKTSIIERIRDSYNAISLFRRVAELKFRGINVDIAREEKLEIIPCTYQYINEGTKIQIAGLFEYIPIMFPEFQVLGNSDKWLLVRNYYRCFHCLDSALRVLQNYGKDSFEFFFGSYTTIVSAQTIDFLFVDCPDRTNAATAAKMVLDSFNTIIGAMRDQIRQVDPREDEFMALLGLAFWSFENIDPSEELLALATRYRAAIIAELMVRYRRSIGEQSATSRVGVLLCFLQEFKRHEINLQTDYDVYHMLGVFDDHTVTYQLSIR